MVAMVFIPLGFSCSFFGMNVNALGTGNLSIGCFFLLAFLSGVLAWLLSIVIAPTETFMTNAREAYKLQEHWPLWSEAKITKSMLVRSWFRHKYRIPASKVGL